MKQPADWRNRGLDILLFVLTVAAVVGSTWKAVPDWLQTSFLVLFVLFFVIRWRLDEDRRAYIRSNWIDLVFVVVLASPMLRLFTALRFARLMPVMKIGAILRANRRHILRMILLSRESFPIAMALIFGTVFLFGTCVFLLEHDSNPGFATIRDGLWWAFVTLTTVGYGDIVPHTGAGRVVAVMLMVFGVAVYSLMIANLTHFLETIDDDRDNRAAPAEAPEAVPVDDRKAARAKRND